MTAPNARPLEGVTVCDFTHGVAGPYTTMILADLGADVWKIEKPGRGDATRYMNMSPRFGAAIPDVGGDYFLAINRNKRSVGLDMSDAEGRRLALELAARADIVVSNFRPGVMRRLGLTFESISALNPRTIFASLTAYGEHGPLSVQPGMDVAVQARSGVMSITGYGGDDPVKPGVSLADFAGGSHLATAVLSALYRREKSGQGEEITISLLDATMFMLINYSVAVMDGGCSIEPMGSGHPQLVPFQAFRAADGHIVVATGTNRLFVDLCRVLEVPELTSDARFDTNVVRVANRSELIPLIQECMGKRTVDEWMEIFEAEQIPCAPVNTLQQAFDDPQLRANGMISEVEHPQAGTLHLLSSPYRFSGEADSIRRPPPRLGEHTFDVLGEVLGVDDEALERLRTGGVVT